LLLVTEAGLTWHNLLHEFASFTEIVLLLCVVPWGGKKAKCLSQVDVHMEPILFLFNLVIFCHKMGSLLYIFLVISCSSVFQAIWGIQVLYLSTISVVFFAMS
jgi:hypothetical protein